MIFDVHRQPLDRRVERRALRHRPRQQHAVVFEAQVVVQMAGQVLLDAEEPRRSASAPLARAVRPGGSGDFVKSRLRR